ncbi:MAG: hypothetical protein A4E31_00040 [Methanomassiliicoccales archaeon PtaU1.Bin030]|nr:MAG: hypothetical protein A4E31_00040 [Methanomassiliicoccales archaeon PtaU1.Bin030]
MGILSAPTLRAMVCVLWGLGIPETHSSMPRVTVPENSLPTATSPAWGSTMILVTIRATGPLASQVSMAFPTSESLSPFQMTGIRIFWASRGLGTCSMTMFSRTSWTGAFLARVFWSLFLQYS